MRASYAPLLHCWLALLLLVLPHREGEVTLLSPSFRTQGSVSEGSPVLYLCLAVRARPLVQTCVLVWRMCRMKGWAPGQGHRPDLAPDFSAAQLQGMKL